MGAAPMTFIEQRLSDDCQRAAVASLLGLQYEDVPDLSVEGTRNRGGQHWATVAFLEERALGFLQFSSAWAYSFRPDGNGYVPNWGEWELWGRLDLSGLALGFARSPRSTNPYDGHAVVLYDGRLVWDPHPRREMGIGPLYGFLIPTTLRGERLHL
jgi:hypothetical protein